MGFGGSVQGMIVSLKNNKRKRKTAFEKEPIKNNGAYGKFTDKKKMSPLEFKRFQATLKENNRRKEKQLKLLFGAFMFLMLALLTYILFYYSY